MNNISEITKNKEQFTLKLVEDQDSNCIFNDSEVLQIKKLISKDKKINKDYYSIFLNDKILLFKKINNNIVITLKGYILEYSRLNRLLLLEEQQNYLNGKL